MAIRKLGLIHTSATLVPVLADLCKTHLPKVATFNIVDDSLIKDVIAHGSLTPSVARRVAGHVASAEAAGADTILVTCSSIGAAVERAAGLVDVPVLRVDRPLAEQAIAAGRRIGVAATLTTTLDPTLDLLRRCAQAAGRDLQFTPCVCPGAFDALMSGDADTHDRLPKASLIELGSQVDVIVLAQASMARVAAQLSPAECAIPLLSSPTLAILHLASLA